MAPTVVPNPTEALLHLSSAYLREGRFWRDPERMHCGGSLLHEKTVSITQNASDQLLEQLSARGLESLFPDARSMAFNAANAVLSEKCLQGEAAQRLVRWVRDHVV